MREVTAGEDRDDASSLARAAVARLVALHHGADAGVLSSLDTELASARERFLATLADGPLGALARRAALDEHAAALLGVLLAVEADEGLQQLVVSVTGDRERHRVELWMLDGLLGPATPGAELVGPASALRRAALVDVQGGGAFGRSAVAVAPRILWALRGDRTPDPACPSDVELLLTDLGSGQGTDALVVGSDRTRRRQRAMRQLDAATCLALRAPDDPASWDALVREATLAGAGIVLDVEGDLPDAGRRTIERARHLRWALCSRTPIELDHLPHRDWREVAADEHDATADEWRAALGDDVPRAHRLTATQLDQMRVALAAHGGDTGAAFRRLTNPKLDALAQHVRPRAGWEDLVLSPGRTARLRDLVLRYRHAGTVYDEWGFRPSPSRGLVALFSGPSGTGKTLAAEVVAGELGLDLYRMDLSSVVSKYIGETEKNLDALFDAAGTGNFVLFFDEADSLFAKRGDVGDAHDRYANLETSYLLQRLERYDGVVVLATNYEKNIDQAFMRRIHVRIDFATPTPAERLQLWRHHSAPGQPLADDVDLAWLADRFDLTGAAIRNAVIDAAFLAAAEGHRIDMSALVRGVAREQRKLGRLMQLDTFGEWSPAVETLLVD